MFTKCLLEQLGFAKVRKAIKIVDASNKPLQVTSGELYLPFGVSSWENKYSDYNDYSLQCYVDKTEGFQEFCEELNERIQNMSNESSMIDTTNVDFTPILKHNKDFPKLLKINLPRDRFGNFDFVVFDQDSNKIMVTEDNIENIFCKKRTFKCIFENAKLWEYNGKIGTIWNMIQAKYYNIQENPVNEDTDDSVSDDQSSGSDSGSGKGECDNAVYTKCVL